jgi:hypothetical protein
MLCVVAIRLGDYESKTRSEIVHLNHGTKRRKEKINKQGKKNILELMPFFFNLYVSGVVIRANSSPTGII